jgi:cysteine desulfurase
VQALGKIPIDIADLDIDLLSISGHKIGGPAGIGALVARGDRMLAPLIRGGGQERSRRAGTENMIGIVGFGVAATLAQTELDDQDRLARLRNRLEAQITATGNAPNTDEAPLSHIMGAAAERLANTSCLTMPGTKSETQMIAFDLAGIAVGAGAACSSGKVGPSHVLAAMGIAPAHADSAIRVSLGWGSNEAEIDAFVAAWHRIRRQTAREAA